MPGRRHRRLRRRLHGRQLRLVMTVTLTSFCSLPDCARAANDTSGLFLGALVVVALVVLYLVVSKAIGSLRNRGKSDGVSAEGKHLNDPHVREGFMSHVAG